MRPVFMRINNAVKFTGECFGIEKIKDYLLYFAERDKNPNWTSYLDGWDEFVLTIHGYMEDEIFQTVQTCDNNTQVFLFEELRKLLNEDWRFTEELNKTHFILSAYKYNDKLNEEFELSVQEKVNVHQESDNYKNLTDGQEYEAKGYNFPIGLGLNSILGYGNRTLIFRKILCIEKAPTFLDFYQIHKYFQLVEKLVKNFRKIISHHLALYDAGKYVSSANVIIERKQLSNNPEPKLIESTEQDQAVKIEVDLSAAQLLYLFKALKDLGVVKNKNNSDIFRVLSSWFEISTKKDGEDISFNKLRNLWSQLEAKTASFWFDKFIDLSKVAKKDNPNNIKAK